MKIHIVLTAIVVALLPLVVFADPIERPKPGATVAEQVEFYVNRLGNATYGEQLKGGDGHASFWHTAPEQLGVIGSPAVEPLIMKIQSSKNETELSWAFYALLLASQAPDINAAIGRTLPDKTNLQPYYMDPKHHAELKVIWLDWWKQYGTTIQKLADKQKVKKPQAEQGAAPNGP